MNETQKKINPQFTSFILTANRFLFLIFAFLHIVYLLLAIWDWRSYSKWASVTAIECFVNLSLASAFYLFFFDKRQAFPPFPSHWSPNTTAAVVAGTLLLPVAVLLLNPIAFLLAAGTVLQFYLFATVFFAAKARLPGAGPSLRGRTFGAFFVFFLAFVLFVEAGNRTSWFGLFRVDEKYGFALRENRWYGVNEMGYRGPLLPTQKPTGVRRILFLGDSSTFGIVVPADRTMASKTVECLNRNGAVKYEAINAGVPGFNLLQMLWRWEEFEKYQPDLVVVMADCHYKTIARSIRQESVRDRAAAVEQFLRAPRMFGLSLPTTFGVLYMAYFVARKADEDDEKTNLGLLNQTLSAMAERSAVENEPLIFVVYPTISRGDPMQKTVRGFVSSHGLPYIDLTDDFAKEPRRFTMWDELHPNEAGHAALAQAICRQLQDANLSR